jgi:prolyl-tRNA editing enzyme YbaK/EbsC (Cys-tRNA(Pro) deacylase)
MNEGFERLRAYLDAEGVSYHVIHHPTDYRARQAAADTGTPAEDFAKTVFVWIDGKPAMAVVPANKGVALGKLAKAVAAEEVRRGGRRAALRTSLRSARLRERLARAGGTDHLQRWNP